MAGIQSPERIVGLKTEERAVEFLRKKYGAENVVSEGEISQNAWDPTGKIKVAENHFSMDKKGYPIPDALVLSRGPKGLGLFRVVEIKHKHLKLKDAAKAKKAADIFRDNLFNNLLVAVLKKIGKMPPGCNGLAMPELDSNYVLGVIPADGVVDPGVTAEIIRLPQRRDEI